MSLELRLIEEFTSVLGYAPNLRSPETMNEKILHRKLHDRRPILPILQDKKRCKNIVKGRNTTIQAIPTQDSGLSPKPTSYPCIVRINNSTGRTRFVTNDKEWQQAYDRFYSEKDRVWGVDKGEWAYSQIPFSILVDDYLSKVQEFKYYVFSGKTKMITTYTQRRKMRFNPKKPAHEGLSHFTETGEYIPTRYKQYPKGPKQLPSYALDILDDVSKISMNLDFIRVDLLRTEDGGWYLGEYTLYPASGLMRWTGVNLDRELGTYWKLNSNTL